MIHGRTDYNLIQDISLAKKLAMYIINLEAPVPDTDGSDDAELETELDRMKAIAGEFLGSLPPVPPKTVLSIADDEPVFLLRAQDALASSTVRHWAKLAAANGASKTTYGVALDFADAMDEWQKRQVPDVPENALPEGFFVDDEHIESVIGTEAPPDKVVVTHTKSTPKLYSRHTVLALTASLRQQLGVSNTGLVLLNGWEVLRGDMPLDNDTVTYAISLFALERTVSKKLPLEFDFDVPMEYGTITAHVRLIPMSWNEKEVELVEGILVPTIQL